MTTEVESPASGILAKILIPAGQEVPVLTVVGWITQAGEKLPDVAQVKPVSAPLPEAVAAQPALCRDRTHGR